MPGKNGIPIPKFPVLGFLGSDGFAKDAEGGGIHLGALEDVVAYHRDAGLTELVYPNGEAEAVGRSVEASVGSELADDQAVIGHHEGISRHRGIDMCGMDGTVLETGGHGLGKAALSVMDKGEAGKGQQGVFLHPATGIGLRLGHGLHDHLLRSVGPDDLYQVLHLGLHRLQQGAGISVLMLAHIVVNDGDEEEEAPGTALSKEPAVTPGCAAQPATSPFIPAPSGHFNHVTVYVPSFH